MANITIDELMRGYTRVKQNVQREISKAAKEDADYLTLKINESFDDNASKTYLNGYYLEGAGPVYNENTIAFEGTYKKNWAKPYIKHIGIKDGVQLNIIGTDAKILEYGLLPTATPMLRWIHNYDEGYYGAHNSMGEGNWWEAIYLSTGNTSPLVSYGQKGSRFFARDSKPTMFIRKGCKKYEDAVKNNSTSVQLTSGGLKVLIEKELNK